MDETDVLLSKFLVDVEFNSSFDDTINLLNHSILEQYLNNRSVSPLAFNTLIVTYFILILCGAIGNGLVCLVVICRPHMRTIKNVFIINLAVSDLLLCLFTMPFTLMEILLKVWRLGLIMCKLVSALQATSIFVSTLSITAIALDRYQLIVYPTQEMNHKLCIVAILLIIIWITAFLLSLPLFLIRTIDRHYVGLPSIEAVDYCFELWPIPHGRILYSVFSMLIQYVFPLVTISVAHSRISLKLKHRKRLRSTNQHSLKKEEKPEDGKPVNGSRNLASSEHSSHCSLQRANLLLLSIALIFGISWLPLNTLNIIMDVNYSFEYNETFRIIFACCHMMGMSSACSNPLLYGWLNENFRKEFKNIFQMCTFHSSKNWKTLRRPSPRSHTTNTVI